MKSSESVTCFHSCAVYIKCNVLNSVTDVKTTIRVLMNTSEYQGGRGGEKNQAWAFLTITCKNKKQKKKWASTRFCVKAPSVFEFLLKTDTVSLIQTTRFYFFVTPFGSCVDDVLNLKCIQNTTVLIKYKICMSVEY